MRRYILQKYTRSSGLVKRAESLRKQNMAILKKLGNIHRRNVRHKTKLLNSSRQAVRRVRGG